uniref:Phosphofurin acidic cluster sorting protein 2-like n=1 Tax=Dermatophagoides pteronyssinus TaxID=6956 RepID=A0A6P6YJ84_DERPT|nr:phosphofurin acidic cluster sorting protein 2-like [Dermatophagoides pteronyssinus]
MTDKMNTKISSSTAMWSNKPVKMKLFGAWEIDKTPSDCIPRLCSLNINRLTCNKSFGNDVTSIMVAVKMQHSKRILRSNEITIPSSSSSSSSNNQSNNNNEPFDIELDLSFTLQYPHFIKRNRNYLQIILQRRKKYKNKAILGYKTLACGLIDMVEVLQRSTISEKNLDLIGHVKDIGKNDIVARITISSLKSQPIDQDNNSNVRRGKVSIDRPDVYSDDDDFTSAEDGSDSETIEEGNNVLFRRKLNDRKSRKLFTNNEKFNRSVVPTNVQQRNLKQKFISLLKKFRLPDSEAYDSEEKFQEALEKELMSSAQEPPDIDEFFDDEEIDDLDYMTDSGQEFDDVSISSTPKPSLRPFFSSCTLVGQDKSYVFPVAESTTTNTRRDQESQETSGTDGTPDTSDNSQKQTNFEPLETTLIIPTTITQSHNKKKLNFDKEQKRARLFLKDNNKDSNKHHHNHHLNNSREKEKKSLHATMSLLSTTYHKDDVNTNTSKEFVLDQLNKVFPQSEEQTIPEEIIFINLSECIHCMQQPQQQSLIQMFERTNRIIGTNTLNDVKVSFNFLCNRMQKFCNNNQKISTPIKLILIGSDSYVNSFLRFYVESLANKSTEWQNFFRFYIIPMNYLNLNYHSHYYQHNNHSLSYYGSNMLHKYLASIDHTYSQCFFPKQMIKDLDSSRFVATTTTTTENINNPLQSSSSIDNNNNNNNLHVIHEFYQKIINFINNAQTLIQIPIAEAMVTYKDKNIDDESSNQVFIPFICDVKIGLADHGNHSMEEESFNFSTISAINPSSSSIVQQQQSSTSGMNDKCITSPTFNSKDQQQQQHSSTPPNSPSITVTTTANQHHMYSSHSHQSNKESSMNVMMMNEVMDLQVDYWTSSSSSQQHPKILDFSSSSSTTTVPSSSSSSSSNKKGDNCKFTLKNSFRHVQITRLPNFGETNCSSLTFSYITKEKKQKIMRLGKKKEKDMDNKCPRQTIDGICRLVCSYKTSQSPIKLIIDGVEYSGVKFFQLTPQWQTQVKFFPVVIYSNNPPSSLLTNVTMPVQLPILSSLSTTTTAAATTSSSSSSMMIDKDVITVSSTLPSSSSSAVNHVIMHHQQQQQQQQHNSNINSSQNDNYHRIPRFDHH